MSVNCPSCGRFLKWHSSDDPDADNYIEWYTCVCEDVECHPGKDSVLIVSQRGWGKELKKFRFSASTQTPNQTTRSEK